MAAETHAVGKSAQNTSPQLMMPTPAGILVSSPRIRLLLLSNPLLEITAMEPLKKEAMDTLANLPDDADIDEIMYRLYVLDKIRKGREALEQGRTISHEDLRREIAQW